MHVCLLSLGVVLGFGLHPGSGQGNRGKGCKTKAGKRGKEASTLGHCCPKAWGFQGLQVKLPDASSQRGSEQT